GAEGALRKIPQPSVIGHVAHGTDDTQALFLGPPRAEADLDGERRAVLPAPPQIEPDPHRSVAWLLREFRPVGTVAGAERFGDEHIDALPHELLFRPPEQRDRLWIGIADDPSLVHDEAAVGRRQKHGAVVFQREQALVPVACDDSPAVPVVLTPTTEAWRARHRRQPD